jgi:hypothetical protein
MRRRDGGAWVSSPNPQRRREDAGRRFRHTLAAVSKRFLATMNCGLMDNMPIGSKSSASRN